MLKKRWLWLLVTTLFAVPILILSRSNGKSHPNGEIHAYENEFLYGCKDAISGRVTFDNGRPAAGVVVVALFQRHRTGARGEGTSVTNSQGQYHIHGLRHTGYYLHVETDKGVWFPDVQRLVRLDQQTSRSAKNVDLILR